MRCFQAAPNIQYQASDDDYKGSGFDRGHMAAAANHERNQQEMDETFYYSNIAPQNGSNNRGYDMLIICMFTCVDAHNTYTHLRE